MSKSLCHLRFDNNPLGVYNPGQTITGSAIVSLPVRTKIRAISIHIVGYALVVTGELRRRFPFPNETFIGRKNYINAKSLLVQSPHHEGIDMAPGTYTYRFAFELPHELPTSFEGRYGGIRYTIQMALHRPRMIETTCTVPFTVIRHQNLEDLEPTLRLPGKVESVNVFCCGPWPCDPMYVSVQIPITGYVPGQTIALKIEVHNRSRKRIPEIISSLLRIVKYKSLEPVIYPITRMDEIAKMQSLGIDKSENCELQHFLPIPAVSPTNEFCEVLTVNYMVLVEVRISGVGINPRIMIPITIGTLPLVCSAMPTIEHQEQLDVQSVDQPPEQPHPVCNAPGLTDLPPPSYEKEVRPANDEEHSKSYIPYCVIYNFEQPSPTSSDR